MAVLFATKSVLVSLGQNAIDWHFMLSWKHMLEAANVSFVKLYVWKTYTSTAGNISFVKNGEVHLEKKKQIYIHAHQQMAVYVS